MRVLDGSRAGGGQLIDWLIVISIYRLIGINLSLPGSIVRRVKMKGHGGEVIER